MPACFAEAGAGYDRAVIGTSTCYRHPDRVTGVRCQRCERPICPECMIPAAVGVQCPDCVRAARSRVQSARALLQGAPTYVTWALVAVNLLVYLGGPVLGAALGRNPIEAGGLIAAPVAAGEWWRLLTSGFLHGSISHIAFNLLALYMFGTALERVAGSLKYGLVYLGGLLAGSAGALLLSPGSLTIGASGAIFGLFGAVLAAQRASGISLRAGGLLPILILNLVFTLLSPGVSLGGHAGGFLGGLLAGWLLFGPFRRYGTAAAALLSAALFGAGLLIAATGL